MRTYKLANIFLAAIAATAAIVVGANWQSVAPVVRPWIWSAPANSDQHLDKAPKATREDRTPSADRRGKGAPKEVVFENGFPAAGVVMGTISAIEGDTNSFTLQDPKSQTVSIMVSSNQSVIHKDHKRITAAELEVGDRAYVRWTRKNNQRVALHVRIIRQAGNASG